MKRYKINPHTGNVVPVTPQDQQEGMDLQLDTGREETMWEGKYEEPTLTSTNLRLAIHPDNQSPITGDTVTYLELMDEGSGAFIQLEQAESGWGTGGTIRLNITELEFILNKSYELIDNYEKMFINKNLKKLLKNKGLADQQVPW